MSNQHGSREDIAEIEMFIRYAVPEAQQVSACQLVARYRNNPLILRLLKEHYRSLPEACEEAVIGVAELARRQGVSLLVAATAGSAFLYAESGDAVVHLGPYRTELDEEVLAFFGFAGQKEYLARCLPISRMREYPAEPAMLPVCCPVCGVAEGEPHLLGCSLEICPWCDGQLRTCGCRFRQLNTEEIVSEEQLAAFADILAEKGRIPFSVDQRPAYPGTSEGLDKE